MRTTQVRKAGLPLLLAIEINYPSSLFNSCCFNLSEFYSNLAAWISFESAVGERSAAAFQ
jgi:hypothetical protein